MDNVGAASQAIDGPASLLQAKLTPPALPRGHVARAVLVDAVRVRDADHLVSVTSAAGYGKTTLLAEWASRDERPVAWVTLDLRDNDPVELVSCIAAAFAPTQGLPSSFWESMSSPGGSVLGRLGPRLAAAFAEADQPYLVVLDDLHEVTSLSCHDVIDLLVRSVPDGSVFAVAGRKEPPGLASWRVREPVLELGAEDLAFDPDESAHFFRIGGAPLSEESAREVHDQVEGWVAGLQLALIVAQRSGAEDVTGRRRFVADYLRNEVLERLAHEERNFLVRTSVLRQMNADLCDALLDRDDSAARLAELERANLFLRSVGGDWYRYHAAFCDVLRAELVRTEGANASRALHVRASRWYAEHGLPEEAVEHSLEADDLVRAVRLVAQVAQRVNARGRLVTLQRWLARVGDEAILGYPPLAVLAGWAAALAGDAPVADHWATAIEDLALAEPPADGSESYDSARAMFRALTCRSGPDRMLADAEFALSREPLWSPWRAKAEALTAEALLLRDGDGDIQAASALFDDAIASARRSGSPVASVAWLAERALVAMDLSDWAQARPTVATALRFIDEFDMADDIVSTLAHAAIARCALHDGDRDRAGRFMATAMRSRGITTYAVPFWAVRLRLVLGRLHLARAEPVVARHLLEEIGGILRRRPELGSLVRQTERLRELIDAAPFGEGRPPLSTAELRVLPYLQTHLTFDEMAERLHLSRNTVLSHSKAIYRKLGCSGRSETVATAISMGLLGDFVANTTS